MFANLRLKGFVFGLLLLFSPGFAQEASAILAQSAKVYQSLKTSSIEFEQKVFFEVTGEEQKNRGKLILGEGDAFRLESPQIQMISDGVSLWEKRTGSQQVLVKALLDLENAYHPSQILFKYLECEAVSVKSAGSLFHLVLNPKGKIRGLDALEVWLDQKTFLPEKIKTVDVTGNRSDYSILDFETNPSLKAEVFQYQLGEGIELIDMR